MHKQQLRLSGTEARRHRTQQNKPASVLRPTSNAAPVPQVSVPLLVWNGRGDHLRVVNVKQELQLIPFHAWINQIRQLCVSSEVCG